MHQPVAGSDEVYKGAEVDNFNHRAVVNLTNLRFGDDVADPLERFVAGLGRDGGNLDSAVVLNIDLGAGGLGDLADHLTAGADDLADLVLRDVDGSDAGCVAANLFTRAFQRARHLSQNVQSPVTSLVERNPHDVARDARNLDVHLQGGDALLGASDLKVHIAEMVLVAKDVRQHHVVLTFLDQAHGDPGRWSPERHTRIHQ